MKQIYEKWFQGAEGVTAFLDDNLPSSGQAVYVPE